MRKSLKHCPVKKRIVDFSDCKYWAEVYDIIKKELELPEWCGENLDALWDSITGIMYVPSDIKIIYHPATKSAEDLREMIMSIVEVFEEALIKYDMFYLTLDID